MKIKGGEFMEWYDNHFPEGDYYFDSGLDEDPIHNPDGSWKLDPEEYYNTAELGYLAHDNPEMAELSVDKLIKKWQRTRTHEVFVVDVPKDRIEEIVNYLRGRGCKVKT